jgi:hypothetical protein
MAWSKKEISTANKYVKKHSRTLAVKEMQIKTHWDSISPQSEWLLSRNQTIINAAEDAEGQEPLHTLGGEIN